MKKAELVAQLEAAKALTSVVSIDNIVALIQQLETEKKVGLTRELAEEIANKIERNLDNNSSDLVDTSSAEFEISYDNRIELNSVDVNVSDIMDYVQNGLEEFIVDEAEDDSDTE